MAILYKIIKVTDDSEKIIGETNNEKAINQVIKRFTTKSYNYINDSKKIQRVEVYEHGEKIATFFDQPGRPCFASADIFISSIDNYYKDKNK